MVELKRIVSKQSKRVSYKNCQNYYKENFRKYKIARNQTKKAICEAKFKAYNII